MVVLSDLYGFEVGRRASTGITLPQRPRQKASLARTGRALKALFICIRHLFEARLHSSGARNPVGRGDRAAKMTGNQRK